MDTSSEGFWVVVGTVALLVYFAELGLALYVAYEKGRRPDEAFWLATLFGPFGILILALLPTKTTPEWKEEAAGVREALARVRAKANREGGPS